LVGSDSFWKLTFGRSVISAGPHLDQFYFKMFQVLDRRSVTKYTIQGDGARGPRRPWEGIAGVHRQILAINTH